MSTPSYGLPADSSSSVPVCPRHPDTASFVRCQRCNRPACGQCQVNAPTGIQCVDCHRQASKSLPQARTRFGGVARQGKPLVTYSLIALNVVVYLGQWVLGDDFTYSWLLAPYFAYSEPWTLLTSAFLHAPGNPLHLLLNMWALYALGPSLERWLGRTRFAGLYLVSALGGSTFVIALSPLLHEQLQGTLGASGAIFGLFAAFFVVERKFGSQSQQVLVMIAINLAFGFFVGGISWQAHVGGLLTGGLLSLAMLATMPRRLAGSPAQAQASLNRVQWVHCGVFALMLAVLAVTLLAVQGQVVSLQLTGLAG
ncbi:rhomboid family intramembrane serine protease [Micrococcales bacterium 31B]|nr:rhomboid family intramembrane serine protease [Micrococcales bacterium 31B]